MSFGDLFTELLELQRNKGIKKALEKVDEKTKHIIVKPEDCVLTDEEFDEFMKKNKHLIYKKNLKKEENNGIS